MTRFYLLRHGQTTWNADGDRYCGRTDVPLSESGRTQAALAAAALREVRFAAVYASPLQRARETAEAIAALHGLSVATDERLVEIDFGRWEGLTRDEIMLSYGEEWAAWLANPAVVRCGLTGETAKEVYQRANSFFREHNEKHTGDSRHRDAAGSVLVVAHNTFNRLFIAGSLQIPFHAYRRLEQSNTGISIMQFNEKQQVRWLQINETAHLRSGDSDTAT